MKQLDRELEHGLEGLLRPLQEPPVVYLLPVAIGLAYVGWRWYAVFERALAFVDSHRVLVGFLAVLVGALGLAGLVGLRRLWWRWRDRERPADLIADWPELAEGLQLPGSSVLSLQEVQGGLTVQLQLNRFRGQHCADLVAKLPRLESALRVRPGAVRVLPDAERADQCTLRIVSKDPLGKPIPWAPPGVTSITDPITLGLFEDQQPVELRLWETDRQRHVLIAGVNGSGKSGLINVALGSLARCQDLVLWGVDLKGGMEFAAWQPVLGRLATSPASARLLLEAANRALDARMSLLASRRWRRWRPTAKEPLLLIVVDEIAELADEDLVLVQRIARLGRAPGVQLITATQRPSAKQLESTDDSGVALRGQLHTRICMRVTETNEAGMVLGSGLVAQGWRADRLLREPGSFLIYDSPEHMQAVPARCFLMTDQAVQVAVNACKDLRPQLDATTGAAASGQVEQKSDEALDPEAALLAVLRASPTGLSTSDLVRQSPRSRAWVQDRLNRLAERGVVKRLDRGRWAVV
jgi:S-DNA-T family DNA segregation ATPase FtsK/SpoIIIE